jgi:hypothetical protein
MQYAGNTWAPPPSPYGGHDHQQPPQEVSHHPANPHNYHPPSREHSTYPPDANYGRSHGYQQSLRKPEAACKLQVYQTGWPQRGEEASRRNEDIRAVAEEINAIQKAQYNSHRHCYSGTPARTQDVVKGTLVTENNPLAHLNQSMFAKEREWPVLCSSSSEPSGPGRDVWVP